MDVQSDDIGWSYDILQNLRLFDVTVNASGLRSLRISFRWKDAGWPGKRRGKLWVQLLRCGLVIADSLLDHSAMAPDEWENEDIELVDHDVVRKCMCGDVLRVLVGFTAGLGESCFQIDCFTMKICLKRLAFGAEGVLEAIELTFGYAAKALNNADIRVSGQNKHIACCIS